MIKQTFDIKMLEKNDLEDLEKLYRSQFSGIEDFKYNEIFNGRSYYGFENKYYTLKNIYHKYESRKYTVNHALELLNNLKSNKLYDNIDKMKQIISNRNSLKEAINHIDDLGLPNVSYIKSNLDGWKNIANELGFDITSQILSTENIIANIESATDLHLKTLIEKLKNIHQDILNVSMAINTSDNILSGNIKDINEGTEKTLYVNYCFKLVKNLKSLDNYYNDKNLLETLMDKTKVFENLEEYNKIRKDIQNIIIVNNKDVYYSYADKFLKSLNNNDIKDFLIQYKADNSDDNYQPECLLKEIEIKEAYSKVGKVLIFDDLSFAVQHKEGNWKLFEDINERKNILQNIILSDLAYKLRKSPTIAKLFINKLKDNLEYNVEKAYVAADTYLNHEKLLKSKDFNLIEKINEFEFEDLDDTMNAYIKKHKIEQYALSITSNKYKHLYDDITYKNFELLHDLKIPESDLQSYLGKKMAAFKSPKDFNNALKKFYNSFNGFEMETMLEKAKKLGATVLSSKDDVLLLKIHNFQQSKELGSSSWCISREEVHFKSYSEDAYQYFLLDFKKDPIDKEAMIGVTLNKNGTYSASHYKDDSRFFENDTFKVLQVEIIQSDIKSFNHLHADLEKEVSKKDKKTKRLWW